MSTFNLILQRFLLSPLLRRSSLDLIFKSMPYRIVGSLEYYIHGGGQWTAAQHATTNNRLGDVVDKDKPLARLLERDGRKTNIKALKGCCCMLLISSYFFFLLHVRELGFVLPFNQNRIQSAVLILWCHKWSTVPLISRHLGR